MSGIDSATQPERRFERFHPMTVRAAGRLARLAQGGQLSRREIDCYLRELVAMEPRSSEQAVRRLKRLARWRAAFHRWTTPSASGPRRTCSGARTPVTTG